MSPHRDAELFTSALFASAPTGTLLVVSIAPNWAKPHFVTSPGGVIDYAVGTVDAYVRLTSIAKRPPRGKRAGDELTAAVFGIAADLDVTGSPDGKGGTVTDACPDLDAAQELAHMLLEPTLMVGSGYGLQPYWLLTEPIVVRDEDDLRAAGEFARGWQAAMEAAANAAGVRKFDHVADLSRVMRIPGSLNGKGAEPVAVTLIDDGGPRYELGQFVAHVRRNGGGPSKTPEAAPRRVEAILARHGDLAKIVGHKTKKPGDGSLSAWDFQLCCRAAEHDLPDTDLAALIRHHRALQKDAKAERDDYVERTIQAVRKRVGYPAAVPDDMLAELTDLIEVGQQQLRVIGVRITGDGNDAVASIDLDDGTEVFFDRLEHVGKPEKLATQLASRVGVATEFTPLQARRVAALMRRYVGRARSVMRQELLRSSALDLLGAAEVHDFEFDNQAGRWHAWKLLSKVTPHLVWETDEDTGRRHVIPDMGPDTYAERVIVARDTGTGRLFVRCGWMQEFLRRTGLRDNTSEIAEQLEHIGWHRRGKEGRIKATDPVDSDNELILRFYIVPGDWVQTWEATGEEDPGDAR